MNEMLLIHGEPTKVVSINEYGNYIDATLETGDRVTMTRGRYNAECSKAQGALGKKVQCGMKIRNGEKVKRNNRNKIIK